MMHYAWLLYESKFDKTWKIINISNLVMLIKNICLPKHCKIIDFTNTFSQLIKSGLSNFSFYKYIENHVNVFANTENEFHSDPT